PEVFLFLEMAADAFDVNVHPTKAEVRFRNQSFVHEVVRRALMDALGAGGVPELQLQPPSVAQMLPSSVAIPGILGGGAFPSRWVPPNVAGLPSQETAALSTGEKTGAAAATAPAAVAAGSELRPMIPLGQFRDTFIVAVDDEGIAIIDQHVAHE